MTFPDQVPGSAEEFCGAYFEQLSKAAATVDRGRVAQAAARLQAAYRSDAQVFVCGNGGSAAIANQMVCDHLKSIRTGSTLKPRVISLVTTMELLTATANDQDYASVFELPLASLGRKDDVLVTISASGNSPNIVRAMEWARANGLATIGLTGFDGGKSATLSDIHVHVDADNYGIVEDVHQSVTHILTQYIRAVNFQDPGAVKDTLF
jgi:D-sedoheptulose 7-phosphate isomerase